jgi:hypothetical protein
MFVDKHFYLSPYIYDRWVLLNTIMKQMAQGVIIQDF